MQKYIAYLAPELRPASSRKFMFAFNHRCHGTKVSITGFHSRITALGRLSITVLLTCHKAKSTCLKFHWKLEQQFLKTS